MKDLDFDELDQAVSSVLGSSVSDPKPLAPSVEPTQPVTAAPAPVPATTAPVAAPSATPEPAAKPAVSPTVRRRGQFLDMVHPASNMTSQSSAPASPTPATRKKLAPVSTDVTPAVSSPATEPTAAATTVTPAPPTPVESSILQSATETKWPDPLDLMDDPAPKAAAEPASAESAPLSSPTDSVTTPFVPDAKVDKRPLGAFGAADEPAKTDGASDTPSDAKTGESAEKTDGAETSKLDTEKSSKDVSLIDTTPPELQPDVVSVESDAGNELVGPDNPEVSETPVTDTPVPIVKEAEPVPTPATDNGLAQSIPQQYKTPPQTSNDAPHPIFDTHEYHQPLLPAKSKKSRGWLVVVIIVLLLIVGAALGYFAFMAGL